MIITIVFYGHCINLEHSSHNISRISSLGRNLLVPNIRIIYLSFIYIEPTEWTQLRLGDLNFFSFQFLTFKRSYLKSHTRYLSSTIAKTFTGAYPKR